LPAGGDVFRRLVGGGLEILSAGDHRVIDRHSYGPLGALELTLVAKAL